MGKRLICLISYITVLFSIYAVEYTVKSVPNPKKYDANTFVSNPDNIIKKSTEAELNSILYSLEQDTQTEVAVVVLNSIGYDDIMDFGYKLFKEWGIGKAESDNGLLILFVLDRREISFETGLGLEGILTDAMSRRIQAQQMLPEFKKGDYDAGLLAGVNRVASILREEPFPAFPSAQKEIKKNDIPFRIVLIIYILIAILLYWLVYHSARKISKSTKYTSNLDRINALKKEKSTITLVAYLFIPLILFFIVIFFFHLGNIIYIIPVPFLAIPANVFMKNRIKKMRRQDMPCKECGGTMHIVPDNEKGKYLSSSQQFEEKIGSVEYDVFLCDKCGKVSITAYDKASIYSKCPNCGTKAYYLESKKTIMPSTYTRNGVQRATYKCKYCNYRDQKDIILPKSIPPPPPPRNYGGGGFGGSTRSGGGSFGGGSFGGGRSSGGSFGGGRSGGGGATSRW